MKQFRDKSVLITGAGRGIGKRLALAFAEYGARVGLLARSKSELDLAVLEIEHAGGAALPLRADVRDYEQVCAAAHRLRTQYGDPQVAICAAGIQGPIGPFLESDLDAWADAIQVNFLGVVHVCRAVLPSMSERRLGKIIALSGAGADLPRPAFSAYAASKTALARFVETIAEEVRDRNVQVNCLNPGPTHTSMTDEILRAGLRAGEAERAEALKVQLTGGVSPAKQVQMVAFLASDHSNHISGKVLRLSDDHKRLEDGFVPPHQFTLRRVEKITRRAREVENPQASRALHADKHSG